VTITYQARRILHGSSKDHYIFNLWRRMGFEMASTGILSYLLRLHICIVACRGRSPHLHGTTVILITSTCLALTEDKLSSTTLFCIFIFCNTRPVGLIDAWACTSTVYADHRNTNPTTIYVFLMDAPPRSMIRVPMLVREEEAQSRAEGWMQWYLNKVGYRD